MADISKFRNIGLIAHIDAGKTTVTEDMLYLSGLIHRAGSIDDGTAAMDYLQEEKDRGITITAAAATMQWDSHLFHLIDTPGHIDFTVEVERSLRIIDGAVVIFSGVEGVEAQSEKVWHQAAEYDVPKLAFLNKLDRTGASFKRVTNEINDKFHRRALPLQIPYGEENSLSGIIDLLHMKLLRFYNSDERQVVTERIPVEYNDLAQHYREHLLETLADYSDTIATSYLDGQDVPLQQLKHCIRELTIQNQIVPLFAGSAKNRIGIQPLMDAVTDFLPSPLDRGSISAKNPADGTMLTIDPAHEQPFSGLIFKILASTSADLLYVRTYSGTLKKGAKIVNPRTGEKSTIKQIVRLFAKKTETIEQAYPGDIIGVIGPSNCETGDTICQIDKQVIFETMNFPEPVISMAVEPYSNQDKDRLGEALSLICREDPSLRLGKDEETGQWLFSGMGELHLEINLKRLNEQFNVKPKAGEPRVAYRETFIKGGEIQAHFDRDIGDNNIQAGVTLFFDPIEDHSETFKIENRTAKNSEIPNAFSATAEKALREALQTGGEHGYSMIYVKGIIKDLMIYPDKTTESAVTGAILLAMQKAVNELRTVILEPVMALEILAPEESVGEVVTYLQPRRAVIQEMTEIGNVKRVSCDVPLAEMFGFGKALPNITGGRGSFTMEPKGYQELPDTS